MLELTQWWRSHASDTKPWLVLGKGPSFGQRGKFDLSQYHVLSLNHAVRELPVEVAHIIDLDVVEECGESLLRNARWVVMPRHPHVKFKASAERLEQHAARCPILRQLEAEGRLVWYNLSTRPAEEGSPVIQAKFFSAEAVIDLLGTLGVKKIRSLGIDGGRGYSRDFRDLEGKTMLANGHASFDIQFQKIDDLCAKHGLDYAPLVEPLKVFVGTDESQRVATQVLEYTIRKFSTAPIQFQPMFDLPIPLPKDPANRPRTGFSFYRFAIPKLAGYRGRALYIDADMQVFADMAELCAIPFGSQKVLCTNQADRPKAWDFKGSHFKPGRQMSVMLLDCDRLDWDVDEIVRGLDSGKFSYQQLMFDLCVVRPEEIEDRIPPEWNCLEWFEEGFTKLLHYTVVPTQPWKNDQNPLGVTWRSAFREAVAAGAVSADDVRCGIQAGHLKASLAEELGLAPQPSSPTQHLVQPAHATPGSWGRFWAGRWGRAARDPLGVLKRKLVG